MRIIIVASGFTGATLPLANRFSRMGHDVKFFNLVQWDLTSIESIDFDSTRHIPNGFLQKLSKSNRLYSYLDESIDFYILPFWKRKKRLEKILVGKIFQWLNKVLIRKYVKKIIAEHADCINLIVHSERDVLIAQLLEDSGCRLCITYHEVLQGLAGKRCLKTEVVETLKYETPLVLHSRNTANDLLQQLPDVNVRKRIHIINFGLFESYLSYGEGRIPQGLPTNYLLYLGHIHPYKGLRYLYDAVQLVGEELGNFQIVVAGGGVDPILEKMKYDQRFIVMNHFIANDELVGLIRNCQAIVCPYIAASQSGLVQTGMVFDKPIIATRVGAFEEVVVDGENGYLCEPADAKSLGETIVKFIRGGKKQYVSKIPDSLNWDLIAEKYIQLFNCII